MLALKYYGPTPGKEGAQPSPSPPQSLFLSLFLSQMKNGQR